MYFIDIETIPVEPTDSLQKLFEKRFNHDIEQLGNQYNFPSLWEKKAALYAEFGKVICISVGVITETKLRIKSLCGTNESNLLTAFKNILEKSEPRCLCAHNGKEFDFPFLYRRYRINDIPVPGVLDCYEVSTWKLPLKDTMEIWSGCQWKYKISLDLLCHVLGVPSPKQDLSGDQVHSLWKTMFTPNGIDPMRETHVISRISRYCNMDNVACASVYCKLTGTPFPLEIEFV